MAEVYGASQIRLNNKISVPPDVWKTVSSSGIRGDRVFWHTYHIDNNFVLLSDDTLPQPALEFVDTSQYYDEKDNGERDIRPPSELHDVLDGWDETGAYVFFIGYPEMTSDDLNVVFAFLSPGLARVLPSTEDFLQNIGEEQMTGGLGAGSIPASQVGEAFAKHLSERDEAYTVDLEELGMNKYF